MFQPTPKHHHVWTYEQCKRKRFIFYSFLCARFSVISLMEYNTMGGPVGLLVVSGVSSGGGVSLGLL
jgi:hypothetical protein